MEQLSIPAILFGLGFHKGRGYASISSTSRTSSFSWARKQSAGIWLDRNLSVEVVAGCLSSPRCLEGGYSRKPICDSPARYGRGARPTAHLSLHLLLKLLSNLRR